MDSEKGIDVGVLGESPDTRPADQNETMGDPEMVGLSIYEKKALLVNRELNAHGMGRYQVSTCSCRHQANADPPGLGLTGSVVYFLFVWFWLLDRPSLCSSFRTCGSCHATRARLFRSVRKMHFLR